MSVWSGIALVSRKMSATRIFAPCLACNVSARAESTELCVSTICVSSEAAFERCGPSSKK